MSEPPATGDLSPSPAVAREPWPTIPGYEIQEELGRGGMGVVYRARQENGNRMVALKLIRDGALAGPQERARFQIEIEAIARVRHPNVVQIYDAGQHQGRPYFAMELVQGGSLASYIRAQPQLASSSAKLVQTLALAIHHAHARQIVHRDLKPANILMQKVEGAELDIEGEKKSDVRSGSTVALSPALSAFNPIITDFGLAKRLDMESTAWTQHGAVLGTAAYMAPEQAAGQVRDIGRGTDVYSLGAILYELLTGQPPFQGATANQTIDQVLHDEPVMPTRLNPIVPRDLETICLKCLEKEPSRRYASGEELAEELGRFLDGRRVAAVPLSQRDRLERLAVRDGYQIVDEIGRGPRSIVYRALYGPFKQPRALKVFTAGIGTPQGREPQPQPNAAEFEDNAVSRESLIAPTLTHPLIVPVHQTGCWDGMAYLATEYVPHGSLAARLSNGRFRMRDALRLADQLTELMSYLHRQGIVHGNLKPSNVLLGANAIPQITDFRTTGGLFQGPLPAADAEPIGVGYLAPELLAGHPAVEPRPYTDIYGIGIILYESLTGRAPFAAGTTKEMLEKVRSQDPLPPSRINSEVNPLLDAICLRCLRKNPWKRYRRVYDLAGRLRTCAKRSGANDSQ
jgi:serine/threonine protein kinase